MKESKAPRNKLFTVRTTEKDFEIFNQIVRYHNISRSTWANYILTTNVSCFGKTGTIVNAIKIIKGAMDSIEESKKIIVKELDSINSLSRESIDREEFHFQLKYKILNLKSLNGKLKKSVNDLTKN